TDPRGGRPGEIGFRLIGFRREALPSIEKGEKRRKNREGRHPAKNHADETDDAELLEAAEAGEGQGTVRKTSGEGGRPGRGARMGHGLVQCLRVRKMIPALLDVTGEKDDRKVNSIPEN